MITINDTHVRVNYSKKIEKEEGLSGYFDRSGFGGAGIDDGHAV